mmetsp:Transcript_68686/g.161500  ORF Transcript_68686/g.161500 Transcript_68686/m.161500 type:complete len:270 (+) Transcript_68686:524-1333(+)
MPNRVGARTNVVEPRRRYCNTRERASMAVRRRDDQPASITDIPARRKSRRKTVPRDNAAPSPIALVRTGYKRARPDTRGARTNSDQNTPHAAVVRTIKHVNRNPKWGPPLSGTTWCRGVSSERSAGRWLGPSRTRGTGRRKLSRERREEMCFTQRRSAHWSRFTGRIVLRRAGTKRLIIVREARTSRDVTERWSMGNTEGKRQRDISRGRMKRATMVGMWRRRNKVARRECLKRESWAKSRRGEKSGSSGSRRNQMIFFRRTERKRLTT